MNSTKNKNYEWNGYLTVEASFVMTAVLFFYLLVMTASLYIYDRCAVSQDNGLLAFRGSRFTYAQEGYGEVIYGEMNNRNKQLIHQYLTERLYRKSLAYPCFHLGYSRISIEEEQALVQTEGWEGKLAIIKKIKTANPIAVIKMVRRENKYDGD